MPSKLITVRYELTEVVVVCSNTTSVKRVGYVVFTGPKGGKILTDCYWLRRVLQYNFDNINKDLRPLNKRSLSTGSIIYNVGVNHDLVRYVSDINTSTSGLRKIAKETNMKTLIGSTDTQMNIERLIKIAFGLDRETIREVSSIADSSNSMSL